MKRQGFSLIEVLVATALLVMVVGMIGFVFRQSSMSWDSGIRRAEGISQVRAVVGAVERDLRLAVDAREFGQQNSFGNTEMSFVILADPDGDGSERVPMLVKYTGGGSVTRTARRLSSNGNSWSVSGADDSSTLLDAQSSQKQNINVGYSYPTGYSASDGLPAYVSIDADIDVTEKFSGLEVRSYGPNGKKDEKTTSDDIVVK